MLHYVFITATWLIGIAGIGGALAVAGAVVVLGPAVVIPIIQTIAARFIRCTVCIVVTVFILATVGAYWVGHHSAVLDCRDEKKESELAAQRQDNIAAQKAAADEANRAIDIEVSANDRHTKDLAEIEKLKLRKAPACAFDDIDAGGMPSNVHSPKTKPASRAK